MKQNYHNFRFYLEQHCLNFADNVEWDDEQWNQAYASYKLWFSVQNDERPEWVRQQITAALYTEFAREFYQDATEDTHDYWLKA
jgi:hypothetical protein